MRLVVGTAGHIDHGKTALVKALTGIDTDRLKEEKRRGITIELGFAHLPLPGGPGAGVAGLVDVPGHERFVRAMVAGAGGIDVAILVVACDEGVMPQTREHLDVCALLGVRAGVVALTKSDLLAELGAEWLPLLRDEVASLARGTFLEGAETVPCSARTGEGLGALVQAVGRAAASVPARPVDGPLFLPLDRAFTLKGFGTVVTGTLYSGRIAPGDTVDVVPAPDRLRALRVRTVQVHGAEVPEALAGSRTAVNLPGAEPHEVERGSAVVAAGALRPTSMIDCEVQLLASAPRPLADRARLLCHLGTAQEHTVVALVDRSSLAPGEAAFAQLRLGRPLPALPGMRFILRGFSAIEGRGKTLGGGRVLGVHARRARRSHPEALDRFLAMRDGDEAARVAQALRDAGHPGLKLADLHARTAIPVKPLQRALDLLSTRGEAVLFDREHRAYAHREVGAAIRGRATRSLAEYHRAHPLAAGMPREELRARAAPGADPRLFQRVLSQLVEEGAARAEGDHVAAAGHAVTLGTKDEDLRAQIAASYLAAALAPPRADEISDRLRAPRERIAPLLRLLAADGTLVKVSEDLYFHGDVVRALRERLVAHLRAHGAITTQEFKEMVGGTRKYVIPLGEYFDREKLTLRVGEKRVLRGGG